jgi:hypothetical protein
LFQYDRGESEGSLEGLYARVVIETVKVTETDVLCEND